MRITPAQRRRLEGVGFAADKKLEEVAFFAL